VRGDAADEPSGTREAAAAGPGSARAGRPGQGGGALRGGGEERGSELAAHGWYHAAHTHDLQGKEDEARASCTRIRRDYAGQREVAAKAQERLAVLDGLIATKTPVLTLVAVGEDADRSAFVSRDGQYLTRPDWRTGEVVIRDLWTRRARGLLGRDGTRPGDTSTA
jgi:hypothetical protein